MLKKDQVWVKALFFTKQPCYFTSINLRDNLGHDVHKLEEFGKTFEDEELYYNENESYYNQPYYDESRDPYSEENGDLCNDEKRCAYSDKHEQFYDDADNKLQNNGENYNPEHIFEDDYADDKLMMEMGLPLNFGKKQAKSKKQRSSHVKPVDENLRTDWNNYWALHGKTILMNSWIAKYEHYINPEFLEQFSIFSDLQNEINDTAIDFSKMKICTCPKELHGAASIQSEYPINPGPSDAVNFFGSDVFIRDENKDSAQGKEPPSLLLKENYNNMFSKTKDEINTNSEVNEEQWKQLWKEHKESQKKHIYTQFHKSYHNFSESKYEDILDEDSDSEETAEQYLKKGGFIIHEQKNFKAAFQRKHNGRYEHPWKRSQDFVEQYNDDMLDSELISDPFFDMANSIFPELAGLGMPLEVEKNVKNDDDVEMCPLQPANDQFLAALCDVNSDSDIPLVKANDEPMEVPALMESLVKYWHQRYRLFHRYDEGIRLDEESWFSVTPEKIAEYIADRCRCDIIIDAFCGAGGNTIQFANVCNYVIAIDIDPRKIALARHNAKVYEVDQNIEFICGNFLELAPSLKADVVFLNPPWGGPEYIEKDEFNLCNIQPDIFKTFQLSKNITPHIALFVPKNTVIDELMHLTEEDEAVEVEQNRLHSKVKAITAYYGELVVEPELY